MMEEFPVSLGTRSFSRDDLHRFAALSGDANPIHIDAGAARRLGSSGAIVHGAQTLVWCLDRLAEWPGTIGTIASLRVNFDSFLPEDVAVEARLVSHSPSRVLIEARAGDRLVMTAALGIGAPATRMIEAKPDRVFAAATLLDPTADEISTMTGQIPFVAGPASWEAAFPHAGRMLGWPRVAALGAASTLVGMVCPGLYSIFNRIVFDSVGDDDDAALGFRSLSVDGGLRRVGLSAWGGGWAGNLTAMMRHRPVAQLPISALAGLVAPDAFAGMTALVVGGSRGLGEVAAKLVAAGGGVPIVTYATGAADAGAVAAEIIGWGGQCHVMPLDVEQDLAPQLAALPALPELLLHFATPAILPQRGSALDVVRFQRYLRFYATSFHDLARLLMQAGARNLAALYPSTVYVDARPPGLMEYAMAKAAGEVMCRDMIAAMPGFRATILRLPPLATDQNPQIPDMGDAAPRLLAGLRGMVDGGDAALTEQGYTRRPI